MARPKKVTSQQQPQVAPIPSTPPVSPHVQAIDRRANEAYARLVVNSQRFMQMIINQIEGDLRHELNAIIEAAKV